MKAPRINAKQLFFILLRLEDLENIYSQYTVLVSPETRDNGWLGGGGQGRILLHIWCKTEKEIQKLIMCLYHSTGIRLICWREVARMETQCSVLTSLQSCLHSFRERHRYCVTRLREGGFPLLKETTKSFHIKINTSVRWLDSWFLKVVHDHVYTDLGGSNDRLRQFLYQRILLDILLIELLDLTLQILDDEAGWLALSNPHTRLFPPLELINPPAE